MVDAPVDRVVSLRGGDEIARNEPRALVNELIEGVLSVSAGLAPDDRAGRVADLLPAARYVLSVALHIALLEVRGESMQVLIIR